MPKRAANENDGPQHWRQIRSTLEQAEETAAAGGTVEAPAVVSGRALAGEETATIINAVPELTGANAAGLVETGRGGMAV